MSVSPYKWCSKFKICTVGWRYSCHEVSFGYNLVLGMRCKRSFVYVFSRISQNAISCKLRFRFQSSSLKFSCTFIYSCQSQENHWHPKRIWNSNWKSNRKRKLKQSPENMLWTTRSWSNFGKRWQRLDAWPTTWASSAISMYQVTFSWFFGHVL